MMARSSGPSSDYTSNEEKALEAAIWEAEMERGAGAPEPTGMTVTAVVEWAGDTRGGRPRTVHLSGLDLSRVMAALRQSREAKAAVDAVRAKMATGRSTYRAQGWRAQFNQLSKTREGRAALKAAGVDPAGRTLRRWRAGGSPSVARRRGIAEAYQQVRHAPTRTQVRQLREAGAASDAGAHAVAQALNDATGGDVRFRNIEHLEFE